MKRFGSLFITWLIVAFSVAQAVPAKRPYEPTPPVALDFRDTTWVGKTYEMKEWVIVFHADGAVTNTDNGNAYKRSGTWKATGNMLYFELHNKYYEFRAPLTGDTLHGDSSNTAGLRWKTTLRLVPPK